MGTPILSVTNSKGIQVNLLNDAPMKKIKYRYHCTEKGCQKSFTTRYKNCIQCNNVYVANKDNLYLVDI
jgi:rRNA maturation endonuclease Nob1